MAFDLSVIRDGVTYSLSAGTPFSLVSAQGLAYPAVQRTTMRAPAQDGDVDYGYVLEPRTVTLSLQILATSGSALDTHRDTLYDIFRPARTASFSNPTGDPRIQAETPLTLQVTRDDGEVRRLDCYVAGPLDVPLVAAHHAGNLHRAAVQLVAPNPTWYGTALNSYSRVGSSGTLPLYGTITYSGSYYAEPYYDCYVFVYDSGAFDEHTWSISNSAGGSVSFVVTGSTPQNIDLYTDRQVTTINGVTKYSTGVLSLDGLRLTPVPLVSGGTNVFTVSVDLDPGGSATYEFDVYYRNRYLSY